MTNAAGHGMCLVQWRKLLYVVLSLPFMNSFTVSHILPTQPTVVPTSLDCGGHFYLQPFLRTRSHIWPLSHLPVNLSIQPQTSHTLHNTFLYLYCQSFFSDLYTLMMKAQWSFKCQKPVTEWGSVISQKRILIHTASKLTTMKTSPI